MLTLTHTQLRQMFDHTEAEAPNEACGLLAGDAQHVTRVLPAKNVAKDPRVEYLMDPQDQILHFQAMEEQGLELLGIYHSHPVSPAYPSPTDLSMALYPEAVYAIVSLMEFNHPVLRTFCIVDGQIAEVPFQVMPSGTVGDCSPAPVPQSTQNYVDKLSLL